MSIRSINPRLFATLMRLPDSARADLLEFVGSSQVNDTFLADMIESFREHRVPDRSQKLAETYPGMI